jgi:DNA-binding CsgD family transcriptional regulator
MKTAGRLDYLDFTTRIHRLKKDNEAEELKLIIQKFKNYRLKFPVFQNEIFFIIDYARQKHILLTGNVEEIIGYHPNEFLENGLAMIIEIFQKDDFKIYNQYVYSSIVDLFKQQPTGEHGNYIFDFNYRMKTSKNKTVSVLQRSSYVTDPSTSLPLFSYGTCADISIYKQDDRIVKKVSKFVPESTGSKIEEISVDYYYPDPQMAELTKREVELLKWVAEGFSTKQIAAKFHLSTYTVMNHRRNMLRKTNAKNVADLIRFAIQHKII